MSADLSRYLTAQKSKYTIVYGQMIEKKYDSGWIEFIFPRYLKDCNSEKSKYYGLTSEKEAEAFWKTKLLRRNYIELLKAISRMDREEYLTVFSDRGRLRINQSLSIFKEYAVDDDKKVIEDFLIKYY